MNCKLCQKPILGGVVSFNGDFYHANTDPQGNHAERGYSCWDISLKDLKIPESPARTR